LLSVLFDRRKRKEMEKRLREQQGEEEISMEEKIHPVYGLSNYSKIPTLLR
jgi:hypothetical protein